MLRSTQAYIRKHQLLKKSDKVLVGLSGGADSVAMLDLLLRAGYKCFAVHCNFHLRGEESERDEQFVRELCMQLGVELIVHEFNTKKYAAENGISIEMAARELRYRLFEELREQHDCSAIAVAHHQNDQAETLLLNLMRGTGIRGLAGMKAKNGYIIRPLLFSTHNDILRYLSIRHLRHVEDSSNTNTDITRNLIRQQLAAYKPTAATHIAETAAMMNDYSKIVDAYMEKIRPQLVSIQGDETHINIAELLRTPAPETILYELLRDFGFHQTNEIFTALNATSGRYFHSNTHTALKDRNDLIIFRSTGRESILLKADIRIRKKKEHETYPSADELRIIADSKITEKTISFRHYKAGDRFTPIGMHGSRKLQDFLTDLHLTRKQKKEVWLMLSGEEIAWVAGYRISDKYKVTEQTTNVAEITIRQE